MGTGIYVIETTDDILLGMVEFVDGGIVVRTGFVGHPKRVEADDVIKLTSAEKHPDAEIFSKEYQAGLQASLDYIKVG